MPDPASSHSAYRSEPDPLVGGELGGLKVVRRLGQGGMGVVYEAEDPLIKRRVAVKLLPPSVSGDPAALSGFLREAQAAGRLSHPNVVGIQDLLAAAMEAERSGDEAAKGRAAARLQACAELHEDDPDPRVAAAARRAKAFCERLTPEPVTITLQRELEGPTGAPLALTFSRDGGRILCLGWDHRIWIWDTRTWEPLPPVNAHDPGKPAAVLGLSPDGRLLVTGGNDGSLRLWDAAKLAAGQEGPHLARLAKGEGGITGAVFTPDGARVLASEISEPVIRVWDAKTRQKVHSFDTNQPVQIHRLAVSPDGRTLAVGTGVWDNARPHDAAITLWQLPDGAPLRLVRSDLSCVTFLDFHPDGKLLASAHLDGSLRLWNADDGRLVRDFGAPDGVHNRLGTVFSPDGRVLASVGFSPFGNVRLWEVPSGKELVVKTHPHWVYCFAFSPDGRLAATGDFRGRVQIWDVAGVGPRRR